MTLERLLYNISDLGIRSKVINYAAAGSSIYELNALQIKDYPLLFLSPTGQHEVRENTTDYEITLYYLDRLLGDSSNDVQIFSTAIEQVKLMLRNIEHIAGVIEVSETYSISNFTETESMNDRVAGAYATATITVANIGECDDPDNFGTGDLQNKEVYIELNGRYVVGYDDGYVGLNQVTINVDVETDADGSYSEGYETGYDEGKTDGYNQGYDTGKSDGYTEGYDRGQDDYYDSLPTLTITENGTYNTANKGVIVNVDVETDADGSYDEGYNEGYTEGYSKGQDDYYDSLPSLTITENGTYNTANKGVTVNVSTPPPAPSKLDVGANKVKFQGSEFDVLPSAYLDFSSVTDFTTMFKGIETLTVAQNIDAESGVKFNNMFQDCTSLSVVSISNMTNGNDFTGMFRNCGELAVLSFFDNSFEHAGILYYFFDTEMTKLFALTPFNNLKKNWIGGGLNYCPNLNYDSCIGILNGLYDWVGNNETPDTGHYGKLKVHPNFLTTVGDEINIAVNKGWTITT